jgi:hypothetical protein
MIATPIAWLLVWQLGMILFLAGLVAAIFEALNSRSVLDRTGDRGDEWESF